MVFPRGRERDHQVTRSVAGPVDVVRSSRVREDAASLTWGSVETLVHDEKTLGSDDRKTAENMRHVMIMRRLPPAKNAPAFSSLSVLLV